MVAGSGGGWSGSQRTQRTQRTNRTRRTRWRSRTAVVALAITLLLTGATISVFFLPTRADRALPVVRILEPLTGPPGAPTPIVVEPGRSVPVRGVVLHESPMAELRLNGRRLATAFERDGLNAEFSGFVDLTDLQGEDRFEIEVHGVDGSRAIRRFPARRAEPAERSGPPRFEDVADGDRRQRWAVVIGAGSFRDPHLEGRPDAERQARELARFLRSPAAGLGGIPASHIRLLVGDDATTRNLRSALTTFLRAATPKDLVILYVAGRGVSDPDPRGGAYLLTHDTEMDDLPATALPLEHLEHAIAEVYAANRVVLVDAGPELGGPLVEHATARQGGLAVLADSGPGPGPEGAPEVADFTGALLDGLRGAADRDSDGVVRLDEIVAHVPAEVAATSYDRYWPLAWGTTTASP